MAPLRHTHTDAARNHEGTAQVDIDLAVPLLHAHLFKPVHLAEHAGGVDEPGDWAVRGFDIGDAVDDSAFAGDVKGGRPQDGLRARQRLGRDIDDDDALALCGQ